jgi:5,10-methylenetetrahydromethanopterin reductase
MSQLHYGAAMFQTEPIRQMVELARQAEELGYEQLWFGDSHLIWREPYVTMGAAAEATSRIVLSTGVTNPVTRDPTVIASTFASLAELTGGRVAVGIGVGDSSVETLGARRATVKELASAVLEMKSLCEGRSIERSGTEVRLAWNKRDLRVPIFISAGAGSRTTLRLAGRIADGVIVPGTFSEHFLDATWGELERGAEESGRDLLAEGFQFVYWLPTSIDDDGAQARAWVKPHVARRLNRKLDSDLLAVLTEEEQQIAEQVRQGYEWYQHLAAGGKHEQLIPDSLVDHFALAGTPEQCREMFKKRRALWGDRVHQVAIVPYSTRPGGRADVLRLFAKQVFSPTVA